MTYMRMVSPFPAATTGYDDNERQKARKPLVLIIEDAPILSEAFHNVCDFLDVTIETMPSSGNVSAALQRYCPMAVVAEMEARGQDGCNVLMTVSAYDRGLPVLLITGEAPALLGAIDAVEEIWRLSSVSKWPCLQGVAGIVDFLFCAGRKGGCMRLMSV